MTARPVPPAVLRRMRCPKCHSPLSERDTKLVCTCGLEMLIQSGVIEGLHDLDSALATTIESFGYEWTSFSEIQPEDEGYWRDQYFADVPLERLRGTVALDAGCGKGRFSRFTSAHVGALVALDASDAVIPASQNLANLDNVVVMRADLLDLPFEDGSFGFISCLGVLHHLPDPRQGFAGLVRVLEPSGLILLYLYSRDVGRSLRKFGLQAASYLRRVTTRMPHAALRVLSAPVATALFITFVLPGLVGEKLGIARLRRLPLSVYRGRPFRTLWLDTFDRLSAPIEHRYVWAEVEPWFVEFGLEVLSVRESAGLFILAQRPGNAEG